MKIWLIQNIAAPYRIPLFRELNRKDDVRCDVVLLSKGMKNYPQWETPSISMPFKTIRASGFCYSTGYENQICLNPFLIIRMIQEKPDVVVCAGFSFTTLFAVILKILLNMKFVIWSEGTPITEKNRGLLRNVLRKIMVRHAAAFIDAGTQSRAYLESLLPRKHRKKPFFRSYNCVDGALFSKRSASGRHHDLCPENNILFVGQLVERKGVINLLAVYRRLTRRIDTPVGLIMIGDGPLKPNIEKWKSRWGMEHVYLAGFIENHEIQRYYAQCSLFMLLSLHDPNPLVIFEALHAGIPIICSNCAGNATDFIIDGENGYVVDPKDIGGIEERVVEVLGWDQAKRQHAASVSETVVQKANYKDSARAFIEACRFAMGSQIS